ncbi:bifunctional adenosylcobinamide kinase/adenosylcobinamide-phosphate guanylyltransferase [Neobacillus dielmonensis]|uniref:bifunctional adenosylcobinamide kinase/adenosylcobinamide-phosphate guanylyltransferase n=1 Tax=Neobacillus dielmonensis TaxID=1347369 RepID=UPI0005A9ED07|nr:bifunctional adenosylcobinamide kinase/adenosylcobinamide-phosphate guanylyltransferase [Neobacillus dielmonensis]
MAHVPSLVFITGGVRSGKSSFAEKLAVYLAAKTGGQLTYLATGVPSDEEMKERILKHKQDRKSGELPWKTIEKSAQIGDAARQIHQQDIVLLDCITTLLNNELFSSKQTWDAAFLQQVEESIITGIKQIKSRAKALILVSNEVLYEPLTGNNLVYTYGSLLGRLHQQMVREADQAYLIEAGIPILMKEVRG